MDPNDDDKSDSTELSSLSQAKNAVDSLYKFRDHYFERNSLDKAAAKPQDVKKEMHKTVILLEKLQDQLKNKAEYLMLKGKSLNVVSNFEPEALESLSKAVKLDPTLVEAWIHLGECYWKKGNICDAKNCFTGPLAQGNNKVLLRNLSMVLRQVGENASERTKNVEESVEKAKEAVQMDIKDGTSWFILGNAYLSLFFAANQSSKILKKCLSAYQQAEKDSVANCNPDLHYNRATVYKFQADYEFALIGFQRASVLDPTWPDPIEKSKQLLAAMVQMEDLIKHKGRLKGKKLSSLSRSMKPADFGPYQGGSYTSSKGQTVTLKPLPFCELNPDMNSGKVVLGKVACTLTSDEPVPFCFCLVDKDERCIGVAVYNVAQGYGVKIGDAVAIPEPFVQDINVEYKDKSFHYRTIRVDSPVVLVVNGRKQGTDKQAPSVLTVSAVSE